MSNPTMLLIAPLTAAQAARWRGPFDRLVGELGGSDAVVGGLQAWSQSDAFLADSVERAFWQAMADWSLLADLSRELEGDEAGLEVLAARKLAPMAVLMTGLGWDRARRLPGVAGVWLLDPDGVRAAAADVEQAFALSQIERSAVRDRMVQALSLGDQPDLDLDQLLDVVPTAFDVATSRGMGIVSCSAVVC